MPRHRWFISILLLGGLLVGSQMSGCAGAPVQEMSNARQALVAAERVGAEKYAPDLYTEAVNLVKSAQANIRKQEYRQARDDAELARERAIEARRISEAAAAAEK
jgi:hypothetical protein